MEKKKIAEHHLLKALVSQTEIKVFWKDKDRRFLGASQSFLDFYGLSFDALEGKTDEEMGWHIHPEPYKNDEYQVISTGIPIYESAGKCIIKGKVRHIVATKLPVRDDSGEIIGLIGYFRDVTDQKKDTEQLITKVNTDELTGLVNRRGLSDALDEFVKEYETNGVDFALIILYVDNLKEFNDTYGHDFGDEYVKLMAEDLLKICGNSSVVARMNGDYFAILRQIPPTDTPPVISETILTLLDHIRLKQKEIRMINNHSFRVNVAAGWVAYSEFEDKKEIFRQADARMYADKN